MGWLASDVRGATDPTALPASGGTTWPPAIEPPLLPPTSARSECLGHHHLPCSYPATHHASRVREIGRATTNSVVASGPPSAHPKHPGRRSIVCTTSPPARTRTHRWAGTSPYYGEMKIPWRVRFPSAPLPGTLALARRDSSPPAVQHPVGRTKPLIDTGWVSEPSRIYTMGSIALLAERFLMSSSPLRWSSVCWLSQALMAPFLTASFQGSGPPGGLGAHSRGRREITGGSPPASSHPATLAMSGSPARMTTRLMAGTRPSGLRSLRCQASRAAYAPAVPRIAPSRASAPAVAPVRERRVVLLAPAAARVRRSFAVSLRISPTVIPSTPSARRMPAAVDQSRSRPSDACTFRVST